MYINWYFDYFPKIFMVLSFIFNPIFIYLNVSDTRSTLGKYRYLLLSFSSFNTIYSMIEAIIPVAVYGSNYILIVYLSGGPFFESLRFGQLAVSIRCAFIALSYGILTIHFFYRYFALFNPSINETLTNKTGAICLFLFFISYGIVWGSICEVMMHSTDDAREIVKSEFFINFEVNISDISFLNIVFKSSNPSTVYRCWLGISILSLISATSITLYCVLGYQIFAKLQSAHYISATTRKLHRQLLRTLVVQTTIPTVVSFAPCMIVWFLPYFGVHLGNIANIGMIALSAFPFLDALAIIILLPIYRSRFLVSSGEITIGQVSS